MHSLCRSTNDASCSRGLWLQHPAVKIAVGLMAEEGRKGRDSLPGGLGVTLNQKREPPHGVWEVSAWSCLGHLQMVRPPPLSSSGPSAPLSRPALVPRIMFLHIWAPLWVLWDPLHAHFVLVLQGPI